jgi:hypothetical protein
MATVISAAGESRPVKNLGWLIRHWKEVERFQVERTAHPGREGVLTAFLKGGGRYVTSWASLSLCRDWLGRPVFKGVPIDFLGEKTVCGSVHWRDEWEPPRVRAEYMRGGAFRVLVDGVEVERGTVPGVEWALHPARAAARRVVKSRPRSVLASVELVNSF